MVVYMSSTKNNHKSLLGNSTFKFSIVLYLPILNAIHVCDMMGNDSGKHPAVVVGFTAQNSDSSSFSKNQFLVIIKQFCRYKAKSWHTQFYSECECTICIKIWNLHILPHIKKLRSKKPAHCFE